MAQHNETGKTGENTVARYLADNGFEIIARNYNRKWGELDIVARQRRTLYFVEVKSTAISQNVVENNPAERVGRKKLKRLEKAIQTFSLENNIDLNKENWQCDVYVVFLNHKKREAQIEIIENVFFPV